VKLLYASVLFTFALAPGIFLALRGPLRLVHPGLVLSCLYALGYGVPCWMSLATGELLWTEGDVRWDWVPAGLVFASAFLVFLWCGFAMYSSRSRSMRWRGESQPRPFGIRFSFFIAILAAFTFLLWWIGIHVFGYGTPLFSGVPRGIGQWEPHGTAYALNITGHLGLLVLTCLSGCAYAVERNKALWIAPLLFFILRFSCYSRGFMLGPAVFLLGFVLCRSRGLVWVPVIGVIAGLGFFLAAQIRSNIPAAQRLPLSVNQVIETLLETTGKSALSGLSSSFYVADRGWGGEGIAGVVLRSLPIPSPLLSLVIGDMPPVTSLAHALGRGGKGAGFPVPLLGELFMQIGWIGAAIGFVFGMWFGYVWRWIVESMPGTYIRMWGTFFYMASLYCMIISFHGPLRGTTRSLLYAGLLYAFVKRAGGAGSRTIRIVRVRGTIPSGIRHRAPAFDTAE